VTRQITARRGIITTRSAVEVKTTYTVNNVDPRAKTLVVEHPITASMKLISPAAAETTTDNYRFNVSLPANANQTLTVVEERELHQTTQVASMTPDFLVSFIQNKALSAAARKQLEEIAARKRELAGVDVEIATSTARQPKSRETRTASGRT
jgi:hypothetical protein